MNCKEDFEYLKSLSKKELAEQLAENDKKGQLLIADPKYLTEEQVREREEFIRELNNFSEEDTIPFEEAMEGLFKFMEEIEKEYKHESIQNKATSNIL